MSPHLRRFLLLLLLLPAGCSPAIREDRAIQFAPDGRQVAFQHGRDGLFVAETEDAEPTKIFQPDAETIAVSAPLWSPTDKRLIFTTARSAVARTPPHEELPAEQHPAGDPHYAGPTEYTCWLRDEPKAGQPLNVPLFTARCNHSAYVAANLAVRWHPDGQRLLFIEQDDKGQHGLFAYHLQSQARRRVFPHGGDALVFDWTPDGSHLVCVLGDRAEASKIAGIWVGKPGEENWWHVPDSGHLGGLDDLLPARPVWTRDGGRFAFVTTRKGQNEQPDIHALHIGTLESRTVMALIHSDEPIRDLHWRPDGARLGFLRGGDTGVFHLADPAEKKEHAVGDDRFTNFLGWDAAGAQLAFVARQPLPHDPAHSWAFLFLPDVRARHRLLIAADTDPTRMKILFSDMQVTFPRWSPKEAKLSLWATFRPAYRSWLSHLLDLGGDERDPLRGLTLRPGDPALVLDSATGQRQWKAINSREKTQIGHYHLLRREYAKAWRWYEQAALAAPDADDRSPHQFVNRFVHGRDALFFQAYCLDKLGRADEALAKRRRFEETFLPDLSAAPQDSAPHQPTPFGAADIQPTKEQLLHWRDLYVAEVFLSLDAIEDGERYFRDGLQNAASDADRLSKALVLTQFLLLRNRHEEYAELATDTVLLLLLRVWKPWTRTTTGHPQGNLILAYSDGLSLVPLFADDFLARLSEKQVRSLVPRWQKLRPSADDDVKRLGIDLFLQAAAGRLGQKDEQQAAAQRIAANPARSEILGENGVSGLIEGVRKASEMFEQFRQLGAPGR